MVTFDKEAFCKDLAQLVPHLSVATLAVLNNHLDYLNTADDAKYLLEYLENPMKYRMPKVGIDTFIDSPFYLGMGKKVYPKVREVCRQILDGHNE